MDRIYHLAGSYGPIPEQALATLFVFDTSKEPKRELYVESGVNGCKARRTLVTLSLVFTSKKTSEKKCLAWFEGLKVALMGS